ncbi:MULTISPECIES: AIM24 family protein [Ruminococcus]|jgi:uncharacterized protein (AIM24 family)|uniref:TIGR00266 family protein n=1 Tax=Ruminococcus albus 8 TaxID=246199 RepID=E9SGP5_RUMAL|nr:MULTISPECIES: AIM24 family protein [Ruminococcus]MBE6873437.1 AIM24 family protein [Ruminococcus albus]EGC01580.1 hypothetical protein CUS_5721 [Ruminococcus albus 8]MBO5558398.1 AIM24 family protein [Ruminococcus sp.]MBQ9542910.1 AIM24 family protein [Ruminococcus sp.]MBR0528506.1 AIM24 family protein [Ruminococcus sp.]
MVRTNIFQPTEVRDVVASAGNFSVVEYKRDVSVDSVSAETKYFMAQMNMRKRQVIARLNGNGIILQAGAMQVMTGDVQVATNVKGAGDFFKKMIGGSVTGESAIKPRYTGQGFVYLEPTYKYIILEDLDTWGGAVTIDDGMFLACDDSVNVGVVARSNLSSAALGGEGLFNTSLNGKGIVALESRVPREELIVLDLENDCVKIDGNMAVAWSTSLQFTVERTTATLIGSAASGEGLVNVYRGTGRILMAPV